MEGTLSGRQPVLTTAHDERKRHKEGNQFPLQERHQTACVPAAAEAAWSHLGLKLLSSPAPSLDLIRRNQGDVRSLMRAHTTVLCPLWDLAWPLGQQEAEADHSCMTLDGRLCRGGVCCSGLWSPLPSFMGSQLLMLLWNTHAWLLPLNSQSLEV